MKLQQRIILTAALAIVVLSIPALAQKVETDYDHSVNFTHYHTYSWGHILATDPLFEQRMRDAVDRALQAKGWQQVPTGGDATVTAVAIRRNRAEYNTFYTGLGPGWRWHGWGGGWRQRRSKRSRLEPWSWISMTLAQNVSCGVVWRMTNFPTSRIKIRRSYKKP